MPIIRVTPLGNRWQTDDPFLLFSLCSRHSQKGKGKEQRDRCAVTRSSAPSGSWSGH